MSRYRGSRIFLGIEQVLGWIVFPLLFAAQGGAAGFVLGIVVAGFHHALISVGLAIFDIADRTCDDRTDEILTALDRITGRMPSAKAASDDSPTPLPQPLSKAVAEIAKRLRSIAAQQSANVPAEILDQHRSEVLALLRNVPARDLPALDQLLAELVAEGTITATSARTLANACVWRRSRAA